MSQADLAEVQKAIWDPLLEPPSEWARRPSITTESVDWASGDERRIITELQGYGYAVINLGPKRLVNVEEQMLRVARRLGLGQPFIPDLYASRSVYRDSGMHLIGATHQKKGIHSAFVGSDAQALHTDGTLQPLGFVNTTMLGCIEGAFEGGDSVLFNALGAFWNLLTHDQGAASALLWERCLERSATLDPDRPPTVGPAFGFAADRRLLTRYSRTPGDCYYPAPGRDQELEDALNHLSSLARPGSGFYRELTLSPGQLLILANSRLSHGRLAYRDRAMGPSRLLLRALFKKSPSSSLLVGSAMGLPMKT